MPDLLSTLATHIESCMLADRHGLRCLWQAADKRRRQGQPIDKLLTSLAADIETSRQRALRRASQQPRPEYPAELPVSQKQAEIAEAIDKHQVVIVCGETGSGKTTQLPKICLALGRGVTGLIGHTQPRRIAARSVASRIASELGTELGKTIGYKVRFRDQVGPDTYIKLMTDGILLAEIQGDRFLNHYDTLIIDEAHERSLNIDFLLGYLKKLLPRRPDLKVIITSATIDPQRFARYFGDVPVIEVSGRTYPVEVRYRPLWTEDETDNERDKLQAILDASDELGREGPGDILVFLSGEREIREAAEALRKHHPPQTEIVPLFARLSTAEQNKVFQPHKGRRIVLATNVAETSLTVPGIRYVIDTGYVRMSRYSYRTKVQRLPIEKIAQASADQRKGRCGRVAAGVCIRLYDEDDFNNRPPFTDPEIQRTNLANVILQMQALGLGNIEDFPFIEPPDPRQIKDGYHLLEELRATEGVRITRLGRQLARLPVDPRIGRMVLAASDHACLDEVLIIASALSIQDPRERPLDKQQSADEAHARFADERSDFLVFVNLWRFYAEQRRHLSRSKLYKLCRQHFLSHIRMEEWRDIHSQLLTQCKELGLSLNSQPAEYDPVHQSLLAGLLSHIGFRGEEHDYLGARNSRFAIFPGSGLSKKRPKWIMAAELVETGRLYAHVCAGIDPLWAERLGGHLIKRSYSEPHWEKRSAQVIASERTTLFGLIINPSRRVSYGAIDPVVSREFFIRGALVGGEYQTSTPFLRHNQRLIDDIENLEHKSRRQDILVDEDTLFRFYDERLPEGIVSGRHFETWRKQAEQKDPGLLFMSRDSLMQHAAGGITEAQYPKSLRINDVDLRLDYRFEPGHEADGVTVTLPVAILNAMQPQRFEWLVPGLLQDKIALLIKTLPKALRRNFVPAPDFAAACANALSPSDLPLTEALSRQLYNMTGTQVSGDTWRTDELPAHYRMNFQVVNHAGERLAMGRDLSTLQAQLGQQAAESFAKAPLWDVERQHITDWDFDALPQVLESVLSGITIKGYPALVNKGDSLAIQVFDTQEKADAAHRNGLRRLVQLRLQQEIKYLAKNLPHLQRMCLHYISVGQCDQLKEDLISATLDRAFLDNAVDIRDRDVFEARLQQGKNKLVSIANELCGIIDNTLTELAQINNKITNKIKGTVRPAWHAAIEDIKVQLAQLIYPGFIATTPGQWLAQLPRYLKAVHVRLEKLESAPERDRQLGLQLAPLLERHASYIKQHPDAANLDPEVETYRWMLEELRVSLFAQGLRTLFPVSVKRLENHWTDMMRNN